jgi:hypothetical protein
MDADDLVHRPAVLLGRRQQIDQLRYDRVQDTLCDSEILRRLRKLRGCSAAEWVAGAVLKVGLQAVVVAQDCGT